MGEFAGLAVAFVTLVFLELVLVVDNALVVILQCEGLPPEKRARTVRIGLLQGALVRVLLLALVGYLSKLDTVIPGMNWITPVMNHSAEFTIRNGVNVVGGLILMAMAGHHIRHEILPAHHHQKGVQPHARPWRVLLGIFGRELHLLTRQRAERRRYGR